MSVACVIMNRALAEQYLQRSWTWLHEKRKKKKKFVNFLTNFTLKKRERERSRRYPHQPQSITFSYSNPGRDVLNKTGLLLVKFENKGCFHAERRDDYPSDTLWATCQHYAVKKHTFPPSFKSSSHAKRLLQHLGLHVCEGVCVPLSPPVLQHPSAAPLCHHRRASAPG